MPWGFLPTTYFSPNLLQVFIESSKQEKCQVIECVNDGSESNQNKVKIK